MNPIIQNVFSVNTIHEFISNDPKALFGIHIVSRYSNISNNIWIQTKEHIVDKYKLFDAYGNINDEIDKLSIIRLINLYYFRNCEICKIRPLTRKVTLEYNIRACADCLKKYTIPEKMFNELLPLSEYEHLGFITHNSFKFKCSYDVYWKPDIYKLSKKHGLDLENHIKLKNEKYIRRKHVKKIRLRGININERNEIVQNIITSNYNAIKDIIIWTDLKKKIIDIFGKLDDNNTWKQIFINQPIKYKLRKNGKIINNI